MMRLLGLGPRAWKPAVDAVSCGVISKHALKGNKSNRAIPDDVKESLHAFFKGLSTLPVQELPDLHELKVDLR